MPLGFSPQKAGEWSCRLSGLSADTDCDDDVDSADGCRALVRTALRRDLQSRATLALGGVTFSYILQIRRHCP